MDQQQVSKKHTIWDFPSRWEDYRLPRFVMIDACKKNDLTTVMKLMDETEWTPFELMIMAIYGNERGDQVFSFLLPLLSHEDMTKTFFYYNQDIEHTLLSLFCSLIYYHEKLENIQEKMIRLIQAGSQLDQEIGSQRKTALSFMVKNDFNRSVVSWCIETLGANPRKGYLLHYACNFISKDQHETRIIAEQYYLETLNGANTPMAEPDEIYKCKPFENHKMYWYLLCLGLDLEECIIETGLTPLLSVCSEGNSYKVRDFLQASGGNLSLYQKTKEGLDVWFWAEQYKFENWDQGYTYPLRDLLLDYKAEQKRIWKYIFEEVMRQPSLLQDVPVCDMLELL